MFLRNSTWQVKLVQNKKEELICELCHEEIPDISVAQKLVGRPGYCCIECYVQKGVMVDKILEELNHEDFIKKYGENATSEKRVFGKKEQTKAE